MADSDTLSITSNVHLVNNAVEEKKQLPAFNNGLKSYAYFGICSTICPVIVAFIVYCAIVAIGAITLSVHDLNLNVELVSLDSLCDDSWNVNVIGSFYNPTLINLRIEKLEMSCNLFQNAYNIANLSIPHRSITALAENSLSMNTSIKWNEEGVGNLLASLKNAVMPPIDIEIFVSVKTDVLWVPITISHSFSIHYDPHAASSFSSNQKIGAESKSVPSSPLVFLKQINFPENINQTREFLIEFTLTSLGLPTFIRIQFPALFLWLDLKNVNDMNQPLKLLTFGVPVQTISSDPTGNLFLAQLQVSEEQKDDYKLLVSILENGSAGIVISFNNEKSEPSCFLCNILDNYFLPFSLEFPNATTKVEKNDIQAVKFLPEAQDDDVQAIKVLLDSVEKDGEMKSLKFIVTLYDEYVAYLQGSKNTPFLITGKFPSIDISAESTVPVHGKLVTFDLVHVNLDLVVNDNVHNNFSLVLSTLNFNNSINGIKRLFRPKSELKFKAADNSTLLSQLLAIIDIHSLAFKNTSVDYDPPIGNDPIFFKNTSVDYDPPIGNDPIFYLLKANINTNTTSIELSVNANFPSISAVGGPVVSFGWNQVKMQLFKTAGDVTAEMARVSIPEGHLSYTMSSAHPLYQLFGTNLSINAFFGNELTQNNETDSNNKNKLLIRAFFEDLFTGKQIDDISGTINLGGSHILIDGSWPGFKSIEDNSKVQIGANIKYQNQIPVGGIEFTAIDHSSLFVAVHMYEYLMDIKSIGTGPEFPRIVYLKMDIATALIEQYLYRCDKYMPTPSTFAYLRIEGIQADAVFILLGTEDGSGKSIHHGLTIAPKIPHTDVKSVTYPLNTIPIQLTLLNREVIMSTAETIMVFSTLNSRKISNVSVSDEASLKNHSIVSAVNIYLANDSPPNSSPLNLLSKLISLMLYPDPVFKYGVFRSDSEEVQNSRLAMATPYKDPMTSYYPKEEENLPLIFNFLLKSPDLEKLGVELSMSLPPRPFSKIPPQTNKIGSNIFYIKSGAIDFSIINMNVSLCKASLAPLYLAIDLDPDGSTVPFDVSSRFSKNVSLKIDIDGVQNGISAELRNYIHSFFVNFNATQGLNISSGNFILIKGNVNLFDRPDIVNPFTSDPLYTDDMKRLVGIRSDAAQFVLEQESNFQLKSNSESTKPQNVSIGPSIGKLNVRNPDGFEVVEFPCILPMLCTKEAAQATKSQFGMILDLQMNGIRKSIAEILYSLSFAMLNSIVVEQRPNSVEANIEIDSLFMDVVYDGAGLILSEIDVENINVKTPLLKRDQSLVLEYIDPSDIWSITLKIKESEEPLKARLALAQSSMNQKFNNISIAPPIIDNIMLETMAKTAVFELSLTDPKRANLLSSLVTCVITNLMDFPIVSRALNKTYNNHKTKILSVLDILEKRLKVDDANTTDSSFTSHITLDLQGVIPAAFLLTLDNFTLNLAYERQEILIVEFALYNQVATLNLFINPQETMQGHVNLIDLFKTLVQRKETQIEFFLQYSTTFKTHGIAVLRESCCSGIENYVQPSTTPQPTSEASSSSPPIISFKYVFKFTLGIPIEITLTNILPWTFSILYIDVIANKYSNGINTEIAQVQQIDSECNDDKTLSCYLNHKSSPLVSFVPYNKNSFTIVARKLNVKVIENVIHKDLCVTVAGSAGISISGTGQNVFPIIVPVDVKAGVMGQDPCKFEYKKIPAGIAAEIVYPFTASFDFYDTKDQNPLTLKEGDAIYYPGKISAITSFTIEFDIEIEILNSFAYSMQLYLIGDSSSNYLVFSFYERKVIASFGNNQIFYSQLNTGAYHVVIQYQEQIQQISLDMTGADDILQVHQSSLLQSLGSRFIVSKIVKNNLKQKVILRNWKINIVVPSPKESRLVAKRVDGLVVEYYYELIDSIGRSVNVNEEIALNFTLTKREAVELLDKDESGSDVVMIIEGAEAVIGKKNNNRKVDAMIYKLLMKNINAKGTYVIEVCLVGKHFCWLAAYIYNQ